MLRFALVAALTLAASPCVAGSLTAAQSACASANPGFLNTWACIRNAVAAGQAGLMQNDEGVHYLAVGDALAERVRARRMGDAEAKLALANELRAANAAFSARMNAASDALLETGARLLAPPVIVERPSMLRPPVSCTGRRVGNTVYTDC